MTLASEVTASAEAAPLATPGILVLRAFDLYTPPALAVGLLPLVMDKPTLAYPISVAAGTLMITLWLVAFRFARGWRTGVAPESAPLAR
jgi:hypothetical protein